MESTNINDMFDKGFYKGQKTALKEGSSIELKHVANGDQKAIIERILKGLIAFMNSGVKGAIYFGITDEGVVTGIEIENIRKYEDELRKGLAFGINERCINSSLKYATYGDHKCYELEFIEVLDTSPEKYVIKFQVTKIIEDRAIFSYRLPDGHEVAYIRQETIYHQLTPSNISHILLAKHNLLNSPVVITVPEFEVRMPESVKEINHVDLVKKNPLPDKKSLEKITVESIESVLRKHSIATTEDIYRAIYECPSGKVLSECVSKIKEVAHKSPNICTSYEGKKAYYSIKSK